MWNCIKCWINAHWERLSAETGLGNFKDLWCLFQQLLNFSMMIFISSYSLNCRRVSKLGCHSKDLILTCQSTGLACLMCKLACQFNINWYMCLHVKYLTRVPSVTYTWNHLEFLFYATFDYRLVATTQSSHGNLVTNMYNLAPTQNGQLKSRCHFTKVTFLTDKVIYLYCSVMSDCFTCVWCVPNVPRVSSTVNLLVGFQ